MVSKMKLEEYCEFLVKSIAKEPEMVKVTSYEDENEGIILEALVKSEDMGSIIGHSGKNAQALRTMIQAFAYVNDLGRVKLNIDSF